MLERGSYIPWASHFRRLQTEDDLTGDDLKHYEAEIEAMNLILISILNDIYNFVDACITAQSMWQRVECLMRRTVHNKVDRETRFNNENQAIVQADKVNIQSRNSGNDGKNTRRSYVQEEIIEGNNVQNDDRNTQRTLRTTSSGHAANMLLAKQDEARVTLTDEHNNFLVVDAAQMEEIEKIIANICLMAIIQLENINSDAGPSYDSAFL
ncbi:hypothetical protein Tco_1089340, partial [Tanacetum coccineum]